MTIISRLIARIFGLPGAAARAVTVERGLAVPMDDGVILLADRWYPRGQAGERLPIILIRSPYGRSASALVAHLFAERGYQVVVQSARGTFGSGGVWQPFRNEPADGQATLAWLAQQPWFGGSIATLGASYQGLSQWAIANRPGEHLKAMAILQSDSDPRSIIYPGGIFGLETVLAWTDILENQEKNNLRVLANAMWGNRSLQQASRALPLGACDRIAFGRTVDYYQEWLAHEPTDRWWEALDFGRDLAKTPAILMVGGWYDLHLPGQLANFCALREAGREVRLVIGPWTHESLGITGYALREGLAWFDRLLRPNLSQPEHSQKPRLPSAGVNRTLPVPPPLRLYLMGRRKWMDLTDWPPLADQQRWYLHGDGSLAQVAPNAAPPRPYVYDPADPTPSVGGGATIVGSTGGVKDQHARERRPDVLTYTSEVLDHAITVVGPLSATLYIRANVECLDLFARLCDVTPRGKSRNVSDGIVRLERAGPDGCTAVRVALWPTAYTFLPGHRLRLQVSSAAHPMYARNLGMGEPLVTGRKTRKAIVAIFNDPEHPSSLEIPVVDL